MGSLFEDRNFRGSVINELKDGQKTVARYKMALRKIAALERENEVYKSVLNLVRDGVIDAFEGVDKAEEYLHEPEKFASVKEAHDSGITLDMFDGLVNTPHSAERSAEEDFTTDLSKRLADNDF